MIVVNAPDTYKKKQFEIACFLAGGCSNTEWQERVLLELNKYTLNSLVIYNPYNTNIENQFKQIEWEFNYLNNYKNDYFIFSVYFDKYTDQPVSMYELGRASVLCKEQVIKVGPPNDPMNNLSTWYHTNWGFPMVVSLHPEAPKKQDILIQCKLAEITVAERTPEEHAHQIMMWYKDIRSQLK